jgi:hypothetical protein
MRHEDMKPRSKAALRELDDMWQRRRSAAIDRVKGTRVKIYFGGKAAADGPETTCPASQLYIPATIAGWKWMQSELLVPYHFTVRLIQELQSCGVRFALHDAETNSWEPLEHSLHIGSSGPRGSAQPQD